VIFFFKRNCEWAAYKERREGERKVLKKKRFSKYTETLIMTSLVPYEKSQQNKSNDIKESHQW
jgi:hypothetical protein